MRIHVCLVVLVLSVSNFTFAAGKTETAVIAGGCFWGVEELMRQQKGVVAAEVGYTGGKDGAGAIYELVKTGATGHAEAVKIEFDPAKTSYENLLVYFFKIHDPTTKNRQGNDVGTQYRSAIFYLDEKQKDIAERVVVRVNKSGAWKKPAVTEVIPYKGWHKAEDYHQDYLQKNPGGYTCHFARDLKF